MTQIRKWNEIMGKGNKPSKSRDHGWYGQVFSFLAGLVDYSAQLTWPDLNEGPVKIFLGFSHLGILYPISMQYVPKNK